MDTAHEIADLLPNGEVYQTEDGRTLHQLCVDAGAEIQRGEWGYRRLDQQTGEMVPVEPSWTRYAFSDDSAIIDCGDAWDIEGPIPWSWEGVEGSNWRMIWGAGPMPVGAEALGFVKHPRDGMLGVAMRLASGAIVHGAAGAVRTMPQDVRCYPTIGALHSAELGSRTSQAKARAARENGRKGGRPRKQ